ncbi:MAG: hypothetical protein VKN72_04800 [Nostocales cyanobacterium 94392]|nr:hypothetical protein [Nostocales cyanobacterium 94392]
MGRYYSGDIEGKFWFGIQSSDDASFFGGQETEPQVLNYYFDIDDLPKIKKGIATCEKKLGSNKKRLDKFFANRQGYNNKELADYLKDEEEKVATLLVWYARLALGQKILECVKKQGDCSFDAEL